MRIVFPLASEQVFFRELEALLHPSPWPPTTDSAVQGKAAAALAVEAVRRVAPALYCQGPPLNRPAGFSNLARLRSAKNYYKYLPARERYVFLRSIRKTDVEFESADAPQLRKWIEDHLKRTQAS